jgi:hypothetical protein
MKLKIFALSVLLAVPSVAADPTLSDCAMRVQVSDGRNLEGLPIPGERAQFLLPCVSKKQMAKVIDDFGSDPAQKALALNALGRASEFQVVLVPQVLEKTQH